jgi:hypothetical protein
MNPLVTLVALSGAYKVILLIAEPFLDGSARHLYDWSFVLAITLAAFWATLAGFWMRGDVTASPDASVGGERPAPREVEEIYLCAQCRSIMQAGMKFCGYCGSSLA